MINRVRAVTLIAFAAVLSALASTSAHAQKPALTENIDEKGRNPYYQLVTTSVRCSIPNDCVFDFNPVPAGSRLVILHVFARYYINDGSSIASNVADLGVEGSVSGRVGDLSVAFPAAPNANSIVIISDPVTFFVEPGKTPFVELENVLLGAGNYTPRVVITGYLVTLNQ